MHIKIYEIIEKIYENRYIVFWMQIEIKKRNPEQQSIQNAY